MVQVCKYPNTPKIAACCLAPLDNLLNPRIFKALSDQTRIQLLSCLAKCCRPCSVSEIAECCDVDFSVVSRHLKVLEDADLISAEKDGRTVWYQVRYAELVQMLRALADAIEGCVVPSNTNKYSKIRKKK